MIDVILVDQPVIDRIPQSHPRLLGSKQRGPLQWGGVQVITCTLQELDDQFGWFRYPLPFGLLCTRVIRKKKRLVSQQHFGNSGRASWSCFLPGGHVLG